MNRSGLRFAISAMALAGLVAVLLLVQQDEVDESLRESRSIDLSQDNAEAANDRSNTFDGSSGEFESGAVPPGARTPTEGDVLGEWGDFVRFRQIAANCRHETKTLVRDEGAEVTVAWHCDARTVADHAYESMSNSQLEQIADQDGVAALILGVRLGTSTSDVDSYQDAIGHLYSAVLLSGEAQAYQTLMAHQDIAFGASYVNDKVDSTANANAYVWALAGEHLGILSDSDTLAIRRAVAADKNLDIDALNAQAIDLAQEFSDRRMALLGQGFD